jgi:hypothetical protein
MIISLPRNDLTGLFHTATGIAFADIAVNGQRETWPIRGSRFRAWLRRCHYEATGTALDAGAIRSTLDLLEARALFDAPERAVHVRIAEHAGHIYLDLADDRWRAVEVGPDGWRVIGLPPVRFRRPNGMLPIAAPERGGSIEALGSFLNVSSRDDFVLIVAWLLAGFRFGGPYPLLAISGEQGSAKTVLSKLLKALVDPNTAPVRALAREERDLMIAANNGHLLAFDNLSGLPFWLSDAFCRLAMRRCCFRRRGRFCSTASRMWSAGRIWRTAQFFSHCRPLRRRSGDRSPSFGASLKSHDRAFSGLCWTQWRRDCSLSWARTAVLVDCREWRISRFGSRLVKPRSGPPAILRAPMQQIGGLPSRASSMAIRLRRGSVTSWPTSKSGRAQRLNFFDTA